MAAVFHDDLEVDQYTAFVFQYEEWDAGGNPVVFAGATATLKARVDPSDAAPILSISTTPTADGVIVLGPVTNGPYGTVPPGVVQVNISAARTAQFTFPVANYDLFITFAGFDPEEFATGRILVKPGNNY